MITADGIVKIGNFGNSADDRIPGRNVPVSIILNVRNEDVEIIKQEIRPRRIGQFGSNFFVAPEIVSCSYEYIE